MILLCCICLFGSFVPVAFVVAVEVDAGVINVGFGVDYLNAPFDRLSNVSRARQQLRDDKCGQVAPSRAQLVETMVPVADARRFVAIRRRHMTPSINSTARTCRHRVAFVVAAAAAAAAAVVVVFVVESNSHLVCVVAVVVVVLTLLYRQTKWQEH